MSDQTAYPPGANTAANNPSHQQQQQTASNAAAGSASNSAASAAAPSSGAASNNAVLAAANAKRSPTATPPTQQPQQQQQQPPQQQQQQPQQMQPLQTAVYIAQPQPLSSQQQQQQLQLIQHQPMQQHTQPMQPSQFPAGQQTFHSGGSPVSPSPLSGGGAPHPSHSPHFQLQPGSGAVPSTGHTPVGVPPTGSPYYSESGADPNQQQPQQQHHHHQHQNQKGGEPKNPNEVKMSVRVMVDSTMAGRVIGKSGETVKKMRDASGAFVDIANSIRGATRRIITVKGTAEPITIALGLMAEALSTREDGKDKKSGGGMKSDKVIGVDQYGQPIQSNDPYDGNGVSGGSDEDFEPTHSLVLLVHNAQVGCIIGRGGSTVRETRESTGAIINVSESMLEGSMEKTVTIKGNSINVRKALALIVRQLSERQDRSTSHNLYTPRPAFETNNSAAGASNNHSSHGGHNSHQQQHGGGSGGGSGYGSPHAPLHHLAAAPAVSGYGAPAQFDASGTANLANAGYSVYPTGYSLSAVPVQTQQQQTLPAMTQQGGQFAPVASSYGQQPQAAAAPSAPSQTIVVPVPDAMIGCVIGKRGQTVREIRQRSRAQITIADLQANQTERMLTVTGTRQNIEMALALIYEKMNSFDPNKRPGSGSNSAAGGSYKNDTPQQQQYQPQQQQMAPPQQQQQQQQQQQFQHQLPHH